jgi:hypothetical protein
VITIAGLARASQRLRLLYWLLLAVVFAASLYFNIRAGIFGADFRGTIWQAGRDVLHGRSPYPAPDVAALARAGNPAVYPAATLVAASPFGLLPFTASAVLWDLACLGALFAALRLVGVRDWRVYAVVFLTFPMAASLELGQLDAVLALGCALVWRWRSAPGVRLALALGGLLVAKVFLWPLLVWTAATRWRQAFGATLIAAGLAVAGWSVIGFAGFSAYPRLLSSLTYAFGPRGYSLMALGTRAGLAPDMARFVPLIAAAALCTVCVSFARRGRQEDAFVAAVGAALFGSPVLWLHYSVILLVAVAVKRPSFSAIWALPIALWVVPTENPSSAVELVGGLCLLTLLLTLALRPSRSESAPRAGMVRAPIAVPLAVERSTR